MALSLGVPLLTSCTTGVHYLLDPPPAAGTSMVVDGTVLAVEADGDFLFESQGALVFVDVGEIGFQAEMGDRLRITGTVDHDADEGEAPEFDASQVVRLVTKAAE